jgi:hypothetical protein
MVVNRRVYHPGATAQGKWLVNDQPRYLTVRLRRWLWPPGRIFPLLCFQAVTSLSIFWIHAKPTHFMLKITEESEDPEAFFLADGGGAGTEAGVFGQLRHEREWAALERCQRIFYQQRPGDFLAVGLPQIAEGGA